MASQAGSPPIGRIANISLWSRLYGLGSVYAKTLRDSRLAFLIVAGLFGGIMLAACKAFSTAYATPESRAGMELLANDLPPIIRGLAGDQLNVGTLGGFVTWKYGLTFPMIAALWSIVALSGTLASEARSGSLDIIAASPLGKRRIAIEKLAAHLTGMFAAVTFLAIVTYLGATSSASLPGDEVSLLAAVGFAARVGLLGIVSGSVAWALAPLLGRASAAGVAGAIMLGGYVASGYQSSVPVLRPIADLSWFHWTAGHVPLAGAFDWLSLVLPAVIAVVLFGVGVEIFSRRDLGVTSAIPMPAMPGALLGTRGPARRAFGDRLPLAIAWGIGLGLFAFVIAGSSRSFADELVKTPDTYNLIKQVFPKYDITGAGGFLQLMFAYMGYIVAGLGASTLVGGWASDEGARRLELLLATPLGRGRWAIAGGLGAHAGIAVMTALAMVGIAAGIVVAGGDLVTPLLGATVIGLWAAAAAGIGFAVGGVWRTSLAAEATAVVVIATFLIDFLGPALKAPDWFNQLAMTSHLGQPMIGVWDPSGIVACLAIAVGGVLLGAWGMRRRDVA
jgi:ABC-2 type transport system permease protein